MHTWLICIAIGFSVALIYLIQGAIRVPKAPKPRIFLNARGDMCARIFQRQDGTYGVATDGRGDKGWLLPTSPGTGVVYANAEIAEQELHATGDWHPVGLDRRKFRRIKLMMLPITGLAALIGILVIPWMLGFGLILHLRLRYWYGSHGFKSAIAYDEPVQALVLLIVGPEPGKRDERLVAFDVSQRREMKTGLKGSHAWTRNARRKLKAAVIQLEKDGAKLTVNSDTLCAYFIGDECKYEYPRAKQVFDELHRDPDFADTRIGEARTEPNPRAFLDSAMLEAIKDAMKQPS